MVCMNQGYPSQGMCCRGHSMIVYQQLCAFTTLFLLQYNIWTVVTHYLILHCSRNFGLDISQLRCRLTGRVGTSPSHFTSVKTTLASLQSASSLQISSIPMYILLELFVYQFLMRTVWVPSPCFCFLRNKGNSIGMVNLVGPLYWTCFVL